MENERFDNRNNGTEQPNESHTQEANSEAGALKESAEKYSLKCEYGKAIAELTKALQIAPDDADLYKKRAEAHRYIALFTYDDSDKADEIEKAEYALAIEDYSAAIKLNPDDIEAYKGRGWIYSYLGDDQKALADYNQAISIDPAMDYVYYLRGELYSGQNKFQAAIDDFNKAISLEKYYLYYWSRGEAYEKKDDLDKAFADFCEAARLADAIGFYFYCDLGDKYKERGEYQQAIEAYSESIKKDTVSASFAYSGRADIYKLQKNYQAALADYTKAIELAGSYPWRLIYSNRAEIYEKLGDNEAALADYKKVIEEYTKIIDVVLGIEDYRTLYKDYDCRAQAGEKLGDNEAALADYKKRESRNSVDSFRYRHCLERSLENSQLLNKKVMEKYTKIIKDDRTLCKSYDCRAQAYKKLGDNEAALADYAKALAISAKIIEADLTELIQLLSGTKKVEYSGRYIAHAYRTRGELYYDTGKYANAVQNLTKAIEFYNKITDFDNK